MIISASRRTDIPNYYSEWFVNRIREGFVYVRNPMNAHQVSRIKLTPDFVDCIVFWTKNPVEMIKMLDQLDAYNYYFQFTLTGYGKDIEPSLPSKQKVLIPAFKELSGKIGASRVVWRYDPIFLSKKYDIEYHIKAFGSIATELEGYTTRVVISFLDQYDKTERNMKEVGYSLPTLTEMETLAVEMSRIARSHNLLIETCAEKIDLGKCGISHGCCIDKTLIEGILKCPIDVKKDANQREECGCIESIDVGAYDTCLNHCKYCYANASEKAAVNKNNIYDINSPLLCGTIEADDVITDRKIKSIKDIQISFIVPNK